MKIVLAGAALVAAVALPSLAYPSYLMGPLKYARQISWPALELVDSALPVPDRPGLGVEVDEEALVALDLRAARA